LLQMKNRK